VQGGPGGSGLSFLYRAGPALAELLDDRCKCHCLVDPNDTNTYFPDDIVSWDPRGINGTTLVFSNLCALKENVVTNIITPISPGVDCYASQTAQVRIGSLAAPLQNTNYVQDIAFSHTNTDVGFEARNLSNPIDRAVYAQQVRKADAENAVIAELCLNRTGEALRHVGTATVVRDLELLSRVIEGPEKPVNFWGFR
jgi:hypothetical protein